MPLEKTKTMNFLRHFTEHSNFAATRKNDKVDACVQRAICFHLSQHTENENKSHKR